MCTAASHCEFQHCNITLCLCQWYVLLVYCLHSFGVPVFSIMCFGQLVHHEVSYMPFLRSCWLTEADSCPPSSAGVTNKRQGSSTRLCGSVLNHLTPNGHFSGRTAPLTSRRCILCIYSTNIRTEYFKHAAHSPFFPLQYAVYFIMLPFLVPVLFTFYVQVC
jgi:hypothetical protein